MIPFIWVIIIIIILCILSSLFIYLFIHSRENFKSIENQRLKYSIQPSIDIITKKLSIPNHHHHHHQEKLNLGNNSFVKQYSNRRQSAIIDSKQIAQIEFSLPPTPEKNRRRSVAICNNIIDSKPSTINSIIKSIKFSNEFFPYLVSFSINTLQSSQLQIYFHSLPSNISIQQLIIKVKLIPDGKIKNLEIKNLHTNEDTEYLIQFSNVSLGKLHEKAISMKFSGKDQAKKTIQLGQIGKIYFNQFKNPTDFIHEIEIIKLSSIEILVSLEQNNEQNLIVDIQRIKGLKFDQKNPTGTWFFQIILLDRHRPLSTQHTKTYRLNSPTFSLHEPFQFNTLAFHPNNLDRIMIMIKFYSNTNYLNEHQCIARIKLASHCYCSGTGTIHWQQFKERQSFSMWHTLIKQ